MNAVFSRRRPKRDIALETCTDRHLDNNAFPTDPTPPRELMSEGMTVSREAAVKVSISSLQDSRDERPVSVPGPMTNRQRVSQQKSFRPMRATDWIVSACMVVLAVTAVYFALKSNEYHRARQQILVNSRATSSVAGDWIGADQRPWIGLTRPTAYPLTSAGGGFAIKLQNFGKTPALNVLITDYVSIEDLVQLTGMQEVANSTLLTAGTLMPDDRFDTNVWFKTSQDGITSLARGKVRAVNYAQITYEDVFHHKHTTQSCFYWHGGLQTPLPCERFNTVD